MKRMMSRLLAIAGVCLVGVVVPAAGPATAASGLTITGHHVRLGSSPDVVVLVGKYTCGPTASGVPERGVIDLGIRQVVKGVEVRGVGYLEPTVCTGRPQRYAAEVTAVAGSFVSGRAHWSASGYVELAEGLQNVYVPPTRIRIRPAVR